MENLEMSPGFLGLFSKKSPAKTCAVKPTAECAWVFWVKLERFFCIEWEVGRQQDKTSAIYGLWNLGKHPCDKCWKSMKGHTSIWYVYIYNIIYVWICIHIIICTSTGTGSHQVCMACIPIQATHECSTENSLGLPHDIERLCALRITWMKMWWRCGHVKPLMNKLLIDTVVPILRVVFPFRVTPQWIRAWQPNPQQFSWWTRCTEIGSSWKGDSSRFGKNHSYF